MNSNIISKNDDFKEVLGVIKKLPTDMELNIFFKELLTSSEINILSKRWRILKMLKGGYTQREIAKELKVSLCKVTRGAKILKDKKSVIQKFIKGE